jgi:hypothetical protein
MAANCGTCSYARTMPADLANAGALVCCFNPPSALQQQGGQFPVVRADLWCAQYVAAAAKKTKQPIKPGVLRKKRARGKLGVKSRSR